MIGKLSGRIDTASAAHIILDVAGVGYLVTCSARTLRLIGAVGESATLHIETQVREDAINLYGFADCLEQEWFRLLTTVQGVGAKVALALLGTLMPEQLAAAIAAQDKAALTQADGVGPKLALRLVTELKDKAQNLTTSSLHLATEAKATDTKLPPSLMGDALSALLNLGYRRTEAFAALTASSQKDPEASLNELIRSSLLELSRKDHAA